MTNLTNFSEEVWKDIKGYEGLYQVSNLATVRALPKRVIHPRGNQYQEMINLKPTLSTSGYHLVTLTKNKIQKAITVHKIVAEAFKPNPTNRPEVNHINGNKTDNRVVNLEWCTRSENIRHAIKTGLIKTSQYNKKINQLSFFE